MIRKVALAALVVGLVAGAGLLAAEPAPADPSAPEVVITRDQARELFGGKAAKMILFHRYREEKKDIRSLFLLDFSREKIEPEFVVSHHTARISPDGTRIAFVTRKGDVRDIINVCRLEKDGGKDKKELDYGGQPTWWVDPKSGEEHIVFPSGCGPGMTLIRPIKKGTCEEGGPLRILSEERAFDGGRSPDGKYLCGGMWWADQRVAELEDPLALRDARFKILWEGGGRNLSFCANPKRPVTVLCPNYNESLSLMSGPKEREGLPLPEPFNRVEMALCSRHPDYVGAVLWACPKGAKQPTERGAFVYQLSTKKWVQITRSPWTDMGEFWKSATCDLWVGDK